MVRSLALYIGGVVVGLFGIDARPVERVTLALLWPLGPLAFVATITLLLAASLIAFPLVGVTVVAALAAAAWWIFR